jgi:hypothetical protein
MNKYLITLVAVFALTACDTRLGTADLTSQVITSMEETFTGQNINVDSLIITRDSSESNIYTGILETTEPGGNFTYSVKVTYDGENMTWRVIE